MLIVQFAPAAKVAPQVPPPVPVGLENDAVTATAMPVAPVPPVLLRVRVWAALVVPRTTLVKLSEVGFTANMAVEAPAPWNSTAPTSNRLGLDGLGRAFPKKSVDGCDCPTGMTSIAVEPAAGA